MAARERLEFDVLAHDVNTRRTFEGIADAADRTERSFDRVGDGAGHLQRQIDESSASVRRLGVEFDKTGDVELLRDIRRERRTLAGLVKLRAELDGMAQSTSRLAVGTHGLSAIFSVKGLVSAAGPVIGTAGTTIGVGLATAILAGLGGALGGAAMSGVIAAGVASAARSAEVKSAWGLLARDAKDVFAEFGGPFVGPTVAAIGEMREALGDVRGDIAAIGRTAATFLRPVAEGLGGFAREALPGLRELAGEAQPIFDMLGEELPKLGATARVFFGQLGDSAEGGADALRMFINVAEGLLLTLGGMIEVAGRTYHVLDNLRRIVNEPGIGLLGVAAEESTVKLMKAKGPTSDLAKAFADLGVSGNAARDSITRIGDAVETSFGQFMSLDQSALRVQTSFREAADAVKESEGRLYDNSAAADAARGGLLRAVDAAEAHRKKLIETKTPAAQANEWFRRTVDALYAQAGAAGASRSDLDKLLRKYIDLYKAPDISKTIRFRQVFTQEGRAFEAGPGGPRFFSHGGRVAGPGSGMSDDIVARLSNGEFVVRASAARSVGYDVLDAVNRLGRVPAVAAGPMFGRRDLVAAFREALDGARFRLDDQSGARADLYVRAG